MLFGNFPHVSFKSNKDPIESLVILVRFFIFSSSISTKNKKNEGAIIFV
jgi:hypothetical protein